MNFSVDRCHNLTFMLSVIKSYKYCDMLYMTDFTHTKSVLK